MTDLAKIPLRGEGPVTWDDLRMILREVLAKQDPRYPQSDFADGLLANPDGTVTLNEAYPEGRDASVVTLTSRIADTGRAADQRFLPIVNAGNRLSAQTTNPLSSTGSASTASITVASHVVQYGFGQVSYNSGTISGLNPLTSYYVYTDDPTYAGGAVAYGVTAVIPDLVANNGRYYVGTITTANSSPTGTITGATQANPCVITCVAHGFSTGNQVTISGVVGMTELNGNTYTITVSGVDTFSLNSTNATGFTAYVSGGTATRVSSPITGGGGGAGWGGLLP